MDITYLHIGMILSTLGLSPHGFALGLYPKGLIPMEIFVHPYIPMILPISSQCGTLVVYPTIPTLNTILYIYINRIKPYLLQLHLIDEEKKFKDS
jgi:hypothetical protein